MVAVAGDTVSPTVMVVVGTETTIGTERPATDVTGVVATMTG